jgi:LAO/AO transport system kinase
LIESRDADDAQLAQALLHRLLPHTGGAHRVGITGVPGVGKSTFIDELGMRLVGRGKRVAVLAIDPSSQVSGGSILGDKTRMARLSLEPTAVIRPSPSSLSPGGVARRTRETMLLCEAAGFDAVLVETVGVGQGETAVADMVDFFLVLVLPGAGDELQGIKKGVFELADALAVNKADGDGALRARHALADLRAALRYLPHRRDSWLPRAIAISGLTGAGLDELWDAIEDHHRVITASGELAAQRAAQQRTWMWSLIRERLELAFRRDPAIAAALPQLEQAVAAGAITSTAAADELLAAFERGAPDPSEPAGAGHAPGVAGSRDPR